MKKLLVLFVIASSSIFVSCSKDDDNGGGNEEKIVGKWEFSKEGSIVGGTEVLVDYENEAPECGKDFIEFRADNTASQVYYFLDFNDECDSDEETATYSISGQNLNITANGESGIVEILTLNNTTLKIKVTEEFEGETFVFISVLNKI
tara:strand:+ start:158351 stop:158794 length:444 start_codon:yes stop_codon:yes gene_type:complete